MRRFCIPSDKTAVRPALKARLSSFFHRQTDRQIFRYLPSECSPAKYARNVFLFIAVVLFIPACIHSTAFAQTFEVGKDLWVNNNATVGTTVPGAQLHIRGAGSDSGFALRIADTAGTDRLVVEDRGRVGIGVTNPNAELQIAGVVAANNVDDNLAYRSCMRYVSATQVKVLVGTTIKIGTKIFYLSADQTLVWSDLDTGSEEGGKDYQVFARDNSGTLEFKIHKTTAYNDYIDADGFDAGGLTYPSGYNATNSKVIGGFHNNATNTSAGPGDILQYSVWDRKNRPRCPDPRGMVKSKNHPVWYDIYLASAWDDGTPAANPGNDPYNTPSRRVRSVYQATIWDTMTWYYAQQRGHNSGKRLLMYDEFSDMATGTPEEVNINGSADPGTTGGHTTTGAQRIVSAIGAEDTAGVMWQWGQQLFYRTDGTTWAWGDNTGGYGEIYRQGTSNPVAPLFGGNWNDGVDCGSRSLYLTSWVWYTDDGIGGRFACDSL